MATMDVLQRGLDVVRRSLWLVVLSFAALAAAWLKLWSPVHVEAVQVERGSIVQEAFGRGTIESQREAAVGFDLVGRLSAVLVDEGTRVTLGQELARLETDQAQADLHSAQTGIGAARAALRRLAAEEERAQALLLAAQRDATRSDALAAAGAVPGLQRDDAHDRLRVVRADLDRVLAQRSEATRGIEVATGGAEQRRVAMVRATLLAPFDGLITRRLREPGDTVSIGTTVLRIVDTHRVYVNAALDETMLPKLALDQPGSIFFPGASELVAGKVTSISWEADRQTHELLVEVTPERLERRIAIGQRADVRLEVGRKERVLSIPVRMVHHDAVGPYVYVDQGGEIGLVRPQLGLTGTDKVEVLGGLSEGDAVLAAPGVGTSLPVGRRWQAR